MTNVQESDLIPELIFNNVRENKYSVVLAGKTVSDIITAIAREPRFANFPNLLFTNPDFEIGSPPEGWNTFDSNIEREDRYVKTGKHSLKVLANKKEQPLNLSNLITTNSDFEIGEPPLGWSAGGSTLKRESTIVKSGAYSLKIQANEADASMTPLNMLLTNADFEAEGNPPAGWNTYDCLIEREDTIVNSGSHSLKVTANKPEAISGDAGASQNIFKPEYRGKTFTFSAWAMAPTSNDKAQTLGIWDGVSVEYSDPVPHDGQWHWVTVTKTLAPHATELRAYAYVLNGIVADTDDVLYVDLATLFEGGKLQSGAGASQDVFKPEYRGKTFTFSTWVMAPPSNDKIQALGIWDGVSAAYSDPISHDGKWHQVAVTKTIDPNATKLEVHAYVLNDIVTDTDDILYVDSAMLTSNLIETNSDFEIEENLLAGWNTYDCIIERETIIAKSGSCSLKVTASKPEAISFDAGASQNIFKPEYRGETFTFGVWAMAPTSNDKVQTLGIWDGVGVEYSDPIPHDGEWHWVTVTKTLDPNATELHAYTYVLTGLVADSDDVLYVDLAMLFEGGKLQSGAGASQDVFKPEYRGRIFTFGAWAMAPTSNDKVQTLGIWDGVSAEYSDPLPHDGEWHWVTVTKTLKENATELSTNAFVLTGDELDTDDVLYVDSATLVTNLFSANADFEIGNPPEGWDTFDSIIEQESAVSKTGQYSIKIMANKPVFGDAGASQNTFKPEYRGKTFTFGAWVMAPPSNDKSQSLGIWDGVKVIYSPPIPHDGKWRWWTVTTTLGEKATELRAYGYVLMANDGDNDDILYMDSAVLILGDYLPALPKE